MTTNLSHQYIEQAVGFFQKPPLMMEVLAKKGQVFPAKAASQPRPSGMGRCYENALRLARLKGLHYVEGYAVSSPELPLPLEHAWCVDDAGQVFDPTWPEGAEYFGMAVCMKALARMIKDNGGYYGFFTNLYRLRERSVEDVRAELLAAAVPIPVAVPA